MYLTRRKNSAMWYLDLRFPPIVEIDDAFNLFFPIFRGQRHFKLSMRTQDRDEAEIEAAEYTRLFKIAIYRAKVRRRVPDWEERLRQHVTPGRRYEDGMQKIDGRQAFVSEATINFLGPNDNIIERAVNPPQEKLTAPYVEDVETAEAIRQLNPDVMLPPRFQKASEDPDAELIERYIQAKAKRKNMEQDVRSTWALYLKLGGRPLARATYEDGERLAEHLHVKEYGRATIQKKLGWLAAAVNFAGRKFKGPNPFVGVIADHHGKKAEKRLPLAEFHMRLCWQRLHELSPEDQLLWKLLATTGMRLGEALSITMEGDQFGTRYVEIGTKNDASERKIPIPDGIGMPDRIEGPLFPGDAGEASKRLNRLIKRCLGKHWQKGLVVHSLRHRASDVFRYTNAGDAYLRRRLLGHAAKDIHDQYGGGEPPMYLLKPMYKKNPIQGDLVLGPEAEQLLEEAMPAA